MSGTMAQVNWGKIARRTAIGALAIGGIALAAPWPFAAVRTKAQEEPARRAVTVTLRKFAFDPPRIEVTQDDLVKVVLRSTDIAHSFTVDAYRIAKRVGGGQTVTFEFRADQPGTFPIYCNIRQDDGCREMKGTLVVRAR